MIVPALLFGGYEVAKQVKVGCRPGGGVHNLDAIARKDDTALEAFVRLANSGIL